QESSRLLFQSTERTTLRQPYSHICLKLESSAIPFSLFVDRAVAFHSRRFAFRGAGGEPPPR
ncbi:hypothetical protein, partial [Bacillus badius]|uniref:hypothetical protein n=1 Tax=Bacillus badius TaxID=1455 RepID=UPI002E243AE9|nr:hypothetical protein [Bacillus badius]